MIEEESVLANMYEVLHTRALGRCEKGLYVFLSMKYMMHFIVGA